MAHARNLATTPDAPAPGPVLGDWARVLVLAGDDLATRAFRDATPVTFGDLGLAPCLRLLADEATDRAARYAADRGATLLLTSLDLTLPDIEWVLGWTNRRQRAAVVSLARLRDPADDEATLRRLRNVAAHEAGHLRGLSHCRREDCLMRSARGPGDVDRRSDAPCAACRRDLDGGWARRLRRWLPTREDP